MWKGLPDNLKSSNRVIAFDILEFGKSTGEITPLSIDFFSEDLLSFKNNLKRYINYSGN